MGKIVKVKVKVGCEENVLREFAQLMPDHIFGYHNVVVHLPVIHLKDETDEVGQDGSGARLCPDRFHFLAGRGTLNGETVMCRSSDYCSVRVALFPLLSITLSGLGAQGRFCLRDNVRA